MESNQITNFSRGLYMDSHPSMQPDGTYPYALNATKDTLDYVKTGVANEASTELCFKLEEGFYPVGWGFLEEKNSIVVFSYNEQEGRSQIGIGNLNDCIYKVLLDDSKLDRKLCFNIGEKIKPQFKNIQPCNHVKVYWSVNSTYYTLDIDGDLCNLTYDDLLLFQCICAPSVEALVSETGGVDLKAGAYQFVAQLEDADTNVTNWFFISDPVYVGSKDNKAGQRSTSSIYLTIDNLDRRYEKVNIGVITTIGGITTQRKITTEYYDGKKITYVYRGTTGQEEEIDLSEIKDKTNGYIRGKDLIQKDGRLFLFSIVDEFNISLQRRANAIEVEYITSKVPYKDAEKFQNFMRDETYALAIWPNYCDGTSGEAAHIPGRKPIPYDLEIIPKGAEGNCYECDVPRWKVENTAFRTELFCPEAISLSENDIHDREWIDERRVYNEIDFSQRGCGKNEFTDVKKRGNCCDEYALGKDLCKDNPPDQTDPTNPSHNLLIPTEFIVGKVDPVTGILDPCGCVPYKEGLSGGYYKERESVPTTSALEYGCEPKAIYSPDGCKIIGYEPTIYSIGQMAYWESEETYPYTKDCEGQYIYGELAGQPIRHHKFPLSTLEPIFYSTQQCVQTKANPANKEDLDTVVHLMGIRAKNINFKDLDFPKPLCPHNPFTIGFIKRDHSNKSIIGKGLFTHTFKGFVDGQEVAIPKNGVNSLEQFDRYSEKDLFTTTGREVARHHGGININAPIYTFHSPDTTFDTPPVDADRSVIEFEYFGCGHRHGLYAEDSDPDKPDSLKINLKGARQAINLNHYTAPASQDPNSGRCLDRLNFELIQTTDVLNVKEHKTPPPFPSTFYEGDYYYGIVFNVDIPPANVSEISLEYSALTYKDKITGSGVSTLKFENTKHYYRFPVTGASTSYAMKVVTTEGCTYEYVVTDLKATFTITLPSGQTSRRTVRTSKNKVSANEAEPKKETYAPEYRCLEGISYAPADSVVKKGNGLTYPLLNLKREKSIYLQMRGGQLRLSDNNSIDRYLSDNMYNGFQQFGGELAANGTCDGSFMGDVGCHSCPIYKAAGHYGSIKRYNPSQYGRLESAGYIPLQIGTADDLLCGKIDIFNGDTFIGQYSFSRTSYISNKININEHIKKRDYDSFFEICDYRCGEPEEGCGSMGDLREEGLRQFNLTGNETDFCWDGRTSFNGNPRGSVLGYTGEGSTDAYFPMTQRTDILFFVETAINLSKRQIGDEDKQEIHYKNTGTKYLDPTIPSGRGWEKAYLSSFGAQMLEAPHYKRFWRSFIKAVTLFTVNCSTLDKILGIKACLVKKCYDGNSNCVMDDNLVKGYGNNHDQLNIIAWNDNYSEYNWDFSKLNDICVFRGYADPYDTCKCIETANVFYYSEKQNPMSKADAYRNFKANSYVEIPAEFGKLKDMFIVNGQLYAQTTDNILNLHTREDTLNTSGGQEVTIAQTQYLRSNPTELFSDIPEGHAGTLDPNASVNTQFGRIFIDQEGKKIFRFSAKGLEEISNFGVRSFLKNNLDIKLLSHFPDYPYSDENTIGYKIGFDHRFNRFIFTKIDYEPIYPEKLEIHGRFFRDIESKALVPFDDETQFFNRSFTLSYDPVDKTWISFHSYYPQGYVWDRDHLYSFQQGGLWKHGSKYGEFQMFYDKYHEHILEAVIKDQHGIESINNDLVVDFEAREYSGAEWIRGKKSSFNGMLVYNDNQSSGNTSIEKKNSNNQLARMTQKEGVVTAEYTGGVMRINELKDRVVDEDSPIFTGKKVNELSQVNKENIGTSSQPLEGKYLVVRLHLDDETKTNLEHITKRVVSGTTINSK